MTQPASRSALGVAGGLVLVGGALAAYLAYAGRRGANELCHPILRQKRETLDLHGLEGEEVELETPDGLKLKAWYVPAARPTDQAIAMFHGHTAARSQLLPYARFLQPHFNCLLVDFRHQGESEGDCATMGYLEAQDVNTAVRYLSARGNKRIGGWGMSMGGAALLRAASANQQIRAVVTDGTFARLESVIGKRARDRGYWLPRLIAKAVHQELRRRVGPAARLGDPEDLIAAVAPRPVLIIHGSVDETSTPDNAQRLYAAARSPKELLVVEGAGHTEPHQVSPLEYENRVTGFFRRYLAERS